MDLLEEGLKRSMDKLKEKERDKVSISKLRRPETPLSVPFKDNAILDESFVLRCHRNELCFILARFMSHNLHREF